MKIYTRTGDEGSTSLLGSERVTKDEARLNAFGTVDEFNAVLGMARAAGLSPRCDQIVTRLQNELFSLGAELASPDPVAAKTALLEEADIVEQESNIDELEAALTPLTNFILPGGTSAAATLHLARNVCRRAEREIVTLSKQVPIRPIVLRYINRTSDLLFVLARKANAEAGEADVLWTKSR